MASSPSPIERPGRLASIFRALSYRNYRLFFLGQGVSLIGTWMQQVAMSWLAYHLTGSPLFLGLIAFMGQIPTLFLGLLAGVFIDRVSRHRILVATQTLAMVQAAVLAALVLSKVVAPWHLLVVSAFLGTVNALDMPTRQAFVVEMVERREDLPNAIALNSSMFNGARLIGPSVAAVLIPLVGEGMCFLLNAVSYLAVIAALLAMRVTPRPGGPPARQAREELREGLAYAYRTRPIKYTLALLALLSLFAMPFPVLMPVFAKEVLHGGADVLGLLVAVSGVGALFGALYLASRKSALGLERWMAFAAALFGAAVIAFSRSRWLALSLPLILVAGFGTMVLIASCNTVLQTVVEDDKRGRVMSLYSVVFAGTAPFGSLLVGFLASHLGAADTLLLSGTCALLGALLFSTKLRNMTQALRAYYAREGELPPAPLVGPEGLGNGGPGAGVSPVDQIGGE